MKKKNIVLASNNEHKALEIRDILGSSYTIVKQSDYNINAIPETGDTFEENAIIKATEVNKITGLTTIGDDSGLVVDALSGEPGIYSARYSGENATDQENNDKLLRRLEDLGGSERNARFQCVIALVEAEDPQNIYTFSGFWEGRILNKPIGKNGFGYDPLFFDPVVESTSAELNPELKNKISHRAKALALLKQHFMKVL